MNNTAEWDTSQPESFPSILCHPLYRQTRLPPTHVKSRFCNNAKLYAPDLTPNSMSAIRQAKSRPDRRFAILIALDLHVNHFESQQLLRFIVFFINFGISDIKIFMI